MDLPQTNEQQAMLARRDAFSAPPAPPAPPPAAPARGQTWQSRIDKRNVIRLRSHYPFGQWRAELQDGTRVLVDANELGRRFVLVGASDGR